MSTPRLRIPRPGLVAAVCLVAFVLWASWLAGGGLAPHGSDSVSVWQFRSLAAARGSLLRLLGLACKVVLRFAPLGFLAVLALPDRPRWTSRALLVGLPACAMGVVTAVAIVWWGERATGSPGPSDLVLPVAGVAIGLLVAMARRRGAVSLLLLPVRVAALAVAMAVLSVLLLLPSLSRDAQVREPQPLDSSVKRHLVDVLRGKNPGQIEPGGTRTLRLTQSETEALIAWTTPLLVNPERLRWSAELGPRETLTLRLSARPPYLKRWMNFATAFHVRIDAGRLWLREPRVWLGRAAVPSVVTNPLAPLIQAGLQAERSLRPALGAVRAMRVHDGSIETTYGHLDLPLRAMAGVIWDDASENQLREAVSRQLHAILPAMESSPPGEDRFVHAYVAAFRHARAHSAGASAVEENRAALVALGLALGSERVQVLVSDVADSNTILRLIELRKAVTTHHRADWPRHFSLSGTITALSAVAPSNAVGLLKEELDAGRNSGFSFGDLLADRSGTTFAERALRDDASADSLQRRIAEGFRIDDVLPEGSDLPENIPDAELRARYGGVGGAVFRRYAAEIERRIATLGAHR